MLNNWIKVHKKQIIIHTTIFCIFVLFCIFIANPIFDKFEAREDKSELKNFSLPKETKNIEFCIDVLSTDGYSIIEVVGWAFIKGESTENSEIYVILKSNSNSYIFSTMKQIRRGVTKTYKNLNMNLDYSGFKTFINAKRLADAEYVIGIFIRKENIEALRYINRSLTKCGKEIKINEIPLKK